MTDGGPSEKKDLKPSAKRKRDLCIPFLRNQANGDITWDTNKPSTTYQGLGVGYHIVLVPSYLAVWREVSFEVMGCCVR